MMTLCSLCRRIKAAHAMSTTPGHPSPELEPIILDVNVDDAHFTAYVGISEADIERAADWVHAEQFEQGDVHVAALGADEPVSEALTELMFHLNPGDTLVLLCDTPDTYSQALQVLGYTPDAA